MTINIIKFLESIRIEVAIENKLIKKARKNILKRNPHVFESKICYGDIMICEIESQLTFLLLH